MARKIKKMIVIPIDGSENALKSLDYINLLFGSDHNIKVVIFYAMPGLPPVVVEESRKNRDAAKQLTGLDKRNIAMAVQFLEEARSRLLDKGFSEDSVEIVFQKRKIGIARDICFWAEDKQADALIITTRGLGKIEAFFMGEIANKVLNFMKGCPIWMVKGSVEAGNVLIAVDNSENAMRAVDHAGFMLSGTQANITVFHSKRDLRRYISRDLLEEFPEFQKICQRKAGEVIAPYLKKAKEMLLQAGLAEEQISIKVVDGTRSTADDILKEAESNSANTVILGRRGDSGGKDFSLGSVAKKVLDRASNTVVCIVP